jgi:hypothetical protein
MVNFSLVFFHSNGDKKEEKEILCKVVNEAFVEIKNFLY